LASAARPRPLGVGRPLPYTHSENYYVDFDVERLLPRMLSTAGPRLAPGDVDGDGLDDLYICGASGQSGALFLQRPDGDLVRADFRSEPDREEVPQ
jgi:hypothetical protein